MNNAWNRVGYPQAMGVDMWGWVEIRDPCVRDDDLRQGVDQWRSVILIDHILDHYRDLFAMLFGVTNNARLPPVVGIRGLPVDISEEASRSFLEAEPFAESWITYAEIADIDWDIDAVDGRPHIYVRGENGSLVYAGKREPMEDELVEEGRTWTRGDEVLKVERISRRQVLENDRQLQLLIDLMARLALRYGPDGVRLVVWFD